MMSLTSTKLISRYSPKVSSSRLADSNKAFSEVRDRHQDIQKIERTLEEVARLINDVGSIFLFFKIPG